MIRVTASQMETDHLGGFICVVEIATHKILYVGRSLGTAATALQPGTHFVWGKDQEQARNRAYQEIDKIKKGELL